MSSSKFASDVRDLNSRLENLLNRLITALSTQRPWQLAAVLVVSAVVGVLAVQAT